MQMSKEDFIAYNTCIVYQGLFKTDGIYRFLTQKDKKGPILLFAPLNLNAGAYTQCADGVVTFVHRFDPTLNTLLR